MDGTCEPVKPGERLSRGFAAGRSNVRKELSPASKKAQKNKK